jgi:AcrR family transcriptional regulator
VIRSLGVPKQSGVALRKIETTRRPSRPLDRIERAHVDKFSARRIELAEAALETLAELGYAKTSLREIAQKSEFTHGVLHYYFRDKVDLICCCVRHYKAKCVTRYDQVTAAAQSRDELMKGCPVWQQSSNSRAWRLRQPKYQRGAPGRHNKMLLLPPV